MVEAIGISLLTKAVDFLFEEGKKILQDIRTRRKESSDTVEKTEAITKPHEQAEVITSKDQALSLKIDEKVWLDSEKEIEHLLVLLEISTKKYRLAEKGYTMYGSALVPPIILFRLEEAEKEVEVTTKKLKDSLSKVYGKEVIT